MESAMLTRELQPARRALEDSNLSAGETNPIVFPVRQPGEYEQARRPKDEFVEQNLSLDTSPRLKKDLAELWEVMCD